MTSSRPSGTRGGLGASRDARAAETRPAESSAPLFGTGIRHESEASRPPSVVPAAAAARARAHPGLAAAAAASSAAPAVLETARPVVSAARFAPSADASTSDADAARANVAARASPRVDVRRRDGRAEATDAARTTADGTVPGGDARETSRRASEDVARGDARFRERDVVAVGTDADGTTRLLTDETDETDGDAAELAVATNVASSASEDAAVPGDVSGDVPRGPIAVVPDAPPTASLADAHVAGVAATDRAVVFAPRPRKDTSDAGVMEVPAATQAAVASGARDRTGLGTGLGTGAGSGTDAGMDAGTSSPTTPSTATLSPSGKTVANAARRNEGFGEEASSIYPPSAKEKADRDASTRNARTDEVGTGTAAPVGPERSRARGPSRDDRLATRGNVPNVRSPYFGGGRDLGRSYAPRGFRGGSVPREPECGDARARANVGADENTLPRYIVRFRENVTDARFFELKREVEASEIGIPVPRSPSAARSTAPPRLRAAAPGFRVAVLGGATRASKRRFRRTHAGDIERVERDVEMVAFSRTFSGRADDIPPDAGFPTRISATRPPATALRPRSVGCGALAQTLLTDAQWNLDRVSAPRGAPKSERSTLDGAFAAPECLCGRGVDVYVVDTGARMSHSEFRGRVGGGANFVDPACDADGSGSVSDDARDDSGHGTHVAGTALGATSGLAKCATLRPVRVLDGDGKGKSSSILEALDWIAARVAAGPSGRRAVVSMSLGGPRSRTVDDAVAEMTERHGVPVIVAAGNEARDAANTSPAGGRAAVAVGSTSCYPEPRETASSGTSVSGTTRRNGARCVADVVSPFSNHGDAVSVYAPGHGVRSAWMSGDDAFRESSGTSMAAPLVAGAAALYLEKYPAAAPRDFARALRTTGTAVTWDDEREGNGGSGGMLDLEAMLRVAPE